VIYTRVSTDEQTTEQQIEACKRFCEFKGLEVAKVVEESASGKDLLKRPKFRELWDQLRRLEYEGIVVFRIDRLGRNVRDMVTFFDEMQNKGIKIFSISENLDNDSPIGRAMVNLMLTMAQLERENISLATKQRLAALKNMGKTLGRPKGSKDGRRRKTKGYIRNSNAMKNK
jgi:site-specific DNA recombinase